MSIMVKRLLPHLGTVLVLFVLAVIYFLPQLEGEVVPQSDMIQYKGMTQEIEQVAKETGEKPLWTNSMFGGMPSYQINTPAKGNYLSIVDGVLRLGLDHPIGLFLTSMLAFYIFLVSLGANIWLAAIGAFAFAFTTNNFTLYEAGHLTKMRAIAYFPLIAAGMVLAYRGRYIWGGLIFTAGLGLNIMANHVQMTYYLALTIPFFIAAELIRDIREKRIPHFIKASAVLLIAAIFAAGSSTSNLWTTYEYSRETMRGKPILAKEEGVEQNPIASSSETEGLSWDYAMQWSNGFIDMIASFIPGAAGGGSSEKLPDDSAVAKDLRTKGYQLPPDFKFPLYWGALPFTSGPIYFGAAVLFLFIMGLFLVKGPLKWWLALGTLLTLLLSMGKNFEAFNQFFYNYVPLYNKFRTPNSVLAIASFLIPVLGLLALDRIIRGEADRKEVMRSLLVAAGVLGGASLVLILLGSSLFSFTHPQDGNFLQFDLKAIQADRQALLRHDALRSFLLVAAATGVIWAFVTGKVSRSYFLMGVGALVVFDLWMVDRRYINYDSFTSKRESEAIFRPRPVDEQILQDKDPNYRVFDLTVSSFQSAQYSYYHKMIGGYHAAKLQRYQDLIDRYISKGDQVVLSMLNTRYFIVPGADKQPMVQQNPGALGNAWFVDSIWIVNTPNEEINALKDINPAALAVVHREFSDYVKGLSPVDNEGTIQLTSYRPDHLVYQSDSQAEALGIFSEIWYGPNKGWMASIDGKPVDFIRANYALRALRIPAGQHKIEFVFHPRSFYTGRTISRIFSGLTVLGLVGFTGFQGYRALQNGQTDTPPASGQPPVQKTSQPAVAVRRPKGKKK